MPRIKRDFVAKCDGKIKEKLSLPFRLLAASHSRQGYIMYKKAGKDGKKRRVILAKLSICHREFLTSCFGVSRWFGDPSIFRTKSYHYDNAIYFIVTCSAVANHEILDCSPRLVFFYQDMRRC